MAGPTISRIEDSEAPRAPVSSAPFLLDDPDSLWLVESGKLDIFLVRIESGEPTDARFPLFRVDAGQAAFGMPSDSGAFALGASALPGTVISVLRKPNVSARPLVTFDERFHGWMEGWITMLCSALSDDRAPRGSQPLEPGHTLSVEDKPVSLSARSGVVWVRHEKGESFFLGRNDLATVNGEGFFPLAANSWLAATPGSEIRTISARELVGLDPEGIGLQVFHARAMSCLITKRNAAADREFERLRLRKASDALSLRQAISRLASIVRKSRELLTGEEASQDPLFLAFQAAGKRLGVTIRPDPDTIRHLPAGDPIAGISRASGVRIRKIALRDRWWEERLGPLVGFTEHGNRPVALLPRRSGPMELYDPSEDESRPVTAQVAATLNPFAYMLYRPFPARPLGVIDLLRFGLSDCRSELITVGLMGIATGLLGAVTPWMTGVIFDRIIPGADRSALLNTSVFLLMVAITSSMFALVRGLAVLRIEGKADAALQAASWDRLLNLPVSFFRDFNSGDLAQRSLGISHMREILTSSTLTAILSGIFSVFNFLLLFYYSWRLALMATVLVALACAASIICGVLQLGYQRRLAKLQGGISSLLLQCINGIAKFRVSGTEGRAFTAWARKFSEQKSVATRSRKISNALTTFNSAFPVFALTIIFWFHGENRLSGQMTTGMFLAFLAAFVQFLGSSLYLSSTMVYALSIVPAYERACPIFKTLPEVKEGTVAPGALTGNIEISHVTFRYRKDAPLVLRDLTLRIRPREFVAFVGASGSGKSTLFRLLLGFEKPESGAVYFDGHDLNALDVQAVRREIGVVLQTSRPVGGSIFENIVGSAPLTLEDAWEAARLSGLAEDIERMPMGMHTYITDGGGGISGGQRQRLMIARAVVAKPRILLFDEATSALDNRTQAIVSRSLEGLQTTRIVIAHRLSTVMNADCIYVLQNGTINQSGTYQQLLEQEGLFRELAKRQLC
jgi:NHLM bacteriocin system ABC transporter ATP-binding protein